MSSSLSGWGPAGNAAGLKGTGYKQINMPTMNANQQQLTQMLHELLGGSSGGLAQGLQQSGRMAAGDQSQFEQMEAPAMRQLNSFLGSEASRFSGMGGSGSRNSSGFQNTMGEAGASLAEKLSSKRMDYQQQALAQLLGLSESLLGRSTFNSALIPKKKSFFSELMGGMSGGLGSGLGSLFGMFS
jgi:hypothetical protein